MRIGINLLYLLPGEVGGTETYARGLLGGFAELEGKNQYVVFVNEESRTWPLPADARIRRVICPLRARRRASRYAFEQVRLPRLLREHRLDLTHSLGYVAPLRCPTPSVVTVPDLNYRVFGDGMSATRRAALSWFVGASVRRAAKVLAISQFAATELRREFRLPSERVAVTLLAATPRPAAAPPDAGWLATRGIRAPYLLAFSSPSPNKNLARLIAAHRTAVERHALPHQLVLVGHAAPAVAEAETSSVRVVRTGFVEQEALDRLLTGAEALVFPSIYEGFGLPLLEAMQAGVPVVSSRAAALPEVGGDAALYFDPQSEAELVARLVEIARDPALRAALRARGLARAAAFRWSDTAAATLAAYDDVLAPGPVGGAAAGRPIQMKKEERT